MTLAPERPGASPAPALTAPLQVETTIGRTVSHFAEAAAETAPGRQLAIVKALGRDWRQDFLATGRPETVSTHDLVTLPYPTMFGLFRAAATPAPYLAITNRMVVVRWNETGDDGTARRRTLLFEPSDVELGANTQYFAALSASTGRAAPLVDRTTLTRHGTVAGHLAALGIAPADVDYLVFDHLHTQDVRRLVGTTAPQADLSPEAPVEPMFPNARLLVQRDELAAMVDLHPMQRPWYQAATFRDVRPEAIHAVDGDQQLGPGVALLSTPGHTLGNQSLVLHTSTGVWASSENAISAECLAPEHSRIPGIRKYVDFWGQDLVLNSNTPEHLATQYLSMTKEKAVVDPSPRDERFPQFLPSSELTRAWWSPGTNPTFTHRGIWHGHTS